MIARGATVNEGQRLIELETDKAVLEVPSSVGGMVKNIRVKEGDKLKVGQVIFTVENGAGSKSKTVETPAEPARQAPAESDSTTAIRQVEITPPHAAPVQTS